MSGPEITVEQIEDTGRVLFLAHGPDGHTRLLSRATPEAARRDGLAYFLSTRVLHEGRWYIADEQRRPFCDGAGNRFVKESP